MRMDRARDRRGFTLVEVAIVLTIAAILIGFAVPQVQRGATLRDVRGARDGVLLLSARARALAMEQARTVELHFDRDGGRASMLQAGDTIETFAFEDQLGVTAESTAGTIVLCYTPRGFAVEPCSTSLPSPVDITFERGGYSAALEVWQLGQMRKL